MGSELIVSPPSQSSFSFVLLIRAERSPSLLIGDSCLGSMLNQLHEVMRYVSKLESIECLGRHLSATAR